MVAHLSTNRAQHRLTSLMDANTLTTTPDHQNLILQKKIHYTIFYTLQQYLDVVRMCEVVRFNEWMFIRIAGSQADDASSLWVK